MAREERLRTVNIDSLKETFFVRKKLNEDHMLTLAELYDAGVKLPPIDISKDNEIVDGRHRYAALKFLDRRAVDIREVAETDRGELLVRALKANVGGSLPPTKEDITYAIKQMIDTGMSRVKIVEALPFPASLVRRHIAQVQSMMTRDRTLKAVKDVTDRGMSVPEAARTNDVDVDAVRDIIAGNRRRKASVGEIKSAMSNAYRGRSRVLANVFSRLLRQYEDGEIPSTKVIEAFEHVDKLHKQAAGTVKDWYKRFEALKKSADRDVSKAAG